MDVDQGFEVHGVGQRSQRGKDVWLMQWVKSVGQGIDADSLVRGSGINEIGELA